MKQSLKFLEKVAALVAVFFLPSQLALHFWPENAFVFGMRVDFLSLAIYVTDILIIFLLLVSIVNNRGPFISFVNRKKYYFIFYLALLFFNTLYSTAPLVTFYKWSKITEYIFFGVYIYLRKDFLGERQILKVLLSSSVFISLIGIMQFFIKSTTGLFYFFGERTFNIGTPGIALVNLNGQSFLRAYSVFSHPNSMAGYLGIVFLTFIFSKILKRKIIWYISILIILFALLLSFSLSSFICLGLIVLFYFLNTPKIFKFSLLTNFLLLSAIASILLPVYSDNILRNFNFPQNIEQRIDLSYVSGKMMGENFLLGGGLNTFIINSVKYKGLNIYLWLLQPVHNIFLLIGTETGIVGLLFFLYFFYKLITNAIKDKNYSLIAICFFILFTGLSDHYWLTLQQNSLIMSFAFGLYARQRSG